MWLSSSSELQIFNKQIIFNYQIYKYSKVIPDLTEANGKIFFENNISD